jgi:hypothetical protein
VKYFVTQVNFEKKIIFFEKSQILLDLFTYSEFHKRTTPVKIARPYTRRGFLPVARTSHTRLLRGNTGQRAG